MTATDLDHDRQRQTNLVGLRSILDTLGLHKGSAAARTCLTCRGPAAHDPRRLGLCAACERKAEEARGIAQLKNVWDAVPEKFDPWAAFGDATMLHRVKGDLLDVRRLERDRGSVTIFGPPGSGKTTLAVAKLRQVLSEARKAMRGGDGPLFRRGASAFFVDAYALAKAGQEHKLGQGRPSLVERCATASYLVVDELGTDVEVFKSSARSVREVLHERYAKRLPTLVATYLSLEDVGRHYGAGIARRIAESCVVTLG